MTGRLPPESQEASEEVAAVLKTVQTVGAAHSVDEILAALRDNVLADADHIGIHSYGGDVAASGLQTIRAWDRDNFALRASLPESVRRLVSADPLVVDNVAALDELLAPVKLYGDDTLHAASLAVLPLGAADNPVGYLVIASRQPHSYTDQQMRTLMALGGHIGNAMARLSLMEALLSHKDRATSLNDLAASLLGAPDLDSLGDALAAGVEQMLPISHLSILAVSPDQPEAGVKTLHGPPLPMRLPLAGTRIAPALDDKKTVHLPASAEIEAGDPWQSAGAEQLIVIPLTVGEQSGSALVLGFEKAATLTAGEIALSEQISRLAGAGLSHLRQMERLQSALNETTLLYSISLAINAAQNLDEVLSTALGEIARIAAADRVVLQLAGPDPREAVEYVETAAFWQDDQLHKDAGDARYPIATAPVISQFPQSRSNLIFNDVQTDQRIEKDKRIDYAKAGVEALMVLPLSTGAVWLGAVLLEAQKGQGFSADQARLARSLADQAALAIDAHLLLQRTRQAIARERALREITERIRQAHSADEVMLMASTELSNLLGIPAEHLNVMDTSDSTKAKLSREEQEFIQSVSTQASLAIENLILLEDTRQAALREQTLRDLTAALNSTLDLDEVLNLILTNLGRVLPHDAANIQLVEGDSVHIVAGRGYEKYNLAMKDLLALRMSLPDTPNFKAMVASKKPLVVSNTEAQPDWVKVPLTAWVKSYIGAPIYVENEIIGFISLDSDTPGYYTEEEHAGLLQAFANQAASAIRNARIYGLTHRQAELMENIAVQLERAAGIDDLMAATVRTLSTSLEGYDIQLRLGNPPPARQILAESGGQDAAPKAEE